MPVDITLTKRKYRDRPVTRTVVKSKSGGTTTKASKSIEEGRPSRRRSYPHAYAALPAPGVTQAEAWHALEIAAGLKED